MELIDTHTHLYLTQFDADRDEVVKRAVRNNITRLLLPNIDSGSIEAMLKMREDFPEVCLPMMGLHPTSVKDKIESELAVVEKWLNKDSFIAIGEIGIDLYWDKTYIDNQLDAFEVQIKWAKERNLPIVIHARNSFREIFSVLDKHADQNLRGVFHSFTGNSEDAFKILEYGFYLGINGIITYKNSGLDTIMKKIPLEKILLETDSPYLTPVPKRGLRNESSFLTYIAENLADIYDTKVERIAEITTDNARNLFGIN